MNTTGDRCFVISPIGPDGSDIREHADDVFDFIIEPALAECGITPFRSDHLKEPGQISQQMLRAIVEERMCLAVLTGRNANVYYELAVAQAARRPVVVLLHKGEDLPFDVQDLRCVYYDLKPRPLREGTYVREIVAHVRALQERGWGVPAMIPSSPEADGRVARFFRRAGDYGGREDWMGILREAHRAFDVMGITLRSWREGRSFDGVVADRAADGCRVRILLMDPDNPVLENLISPSAGGSALGDIRRDADSMHDYFAAIAGREENVEVRRIKIGCPHFQLCRTDARAVYVAYLFGETTDYSPLWDIPPTDPLYEVLTHEFESLWTANG